MESKALVKSTNINVACRFFASTPSRILRMVNICEVVDLFLRKPFWSQTKDSFPNFLWRKGIISVLKGLQPIVWLFPSPTISSGHATWVTWIFFFVQQITGHGVRVALTFILTWNVSHGTLGLPLNLVGMHSSAAASKWALTKFSYLSFEVSVSDISWSASNLFLNVNVYLSLIYLLFSEDLSYCTVLVAPVVFLCRLCCDN